MSKVFAAIWKYIKAMIRAKKTKDIAYQNKTLITSVLVVAVLLPSLATVASVAAPYTFFTSLKDYLAQEKDYTQEEMNTIVSDAGLLYELMEEEGYTVFGSELVMIDAETIMRILRTVDEYNKEVQKIHTLKYKYRVETGNSRNMPQMDPVTGELICEDVEKRDSTFSLGVRDGTIASGYLSLWANRGMSVFTSLIPSGVRTPPPKAAVENAFRKPILPTPVPTSTPFIETTKEPEQAPTPEPTQVPEIKYSVTYEEDTIDLVRVAIDTQRRGDGNYEDVFYMNWQPVVALCAMYIQGNSENWGNYTPGDSTDEEHYYLSDEEIDEIIDIFAFHYTYERDITRSNKVFALSFDSFLKDGSSGFILNVEQTKESQNGVEKITRVTKRIPCIAPDRIFNTYISYDYNYEELAEGGKVLVSRTYTANPIKMIHSFEEKVQDFSEERFLYILQQLPMTEEICEYYESTIFSQASKNGAIYTYTTTSQGVCPVIGVYVSNEKTGWFAGGSDSGVLTESGDGYVVPLYGINGWGNRYLKPGEWIVEEGNSYGSYYISSAAMASLNVSDSLSTEDIEKCLRSYPFSSKIKNNCPLFASDKAIREMAQCLYAYQEDTSSSICGLLGIMLQEGGFASTIATRGWNFFNITVGSSEVYPGIEGYERFRDYRSVYEKRSGIYETPAVNAFSSQVSWIYTNYWSKGQDSYYLMCFNGYDYESPDAAYEGIHHSYCPPWDDQAMPYSQDSYTIYADGTYHYYWKKANSAYRGWINGCATNRNSFLNYTKR